MTDATLPRIALLLGDPTGIGPEIATRVLHGLSTEGILHALAHCPERMLVLERETLSGPDDALFAIAAGCGVPVLLLDGDAG